MNIQNFFLASIGFLGRSLRPDDLQKFVLPVLMTLILLGGTYSTFDLQENYGEKSLNLTLDSLTEKQVLQVQEREFPETMENSLKTGLNSIDSDLRNKINSMRSRPLFMPKGLLSRMIFESGAFPLMPDRMLAPWNPEESYVRTVGLLRFRTDSISELGKNKRDYSYSDFEADIKQIKSMNYESEEVQTYLENSSSSNYATLSFMEDISLEKIMSDGVSSISIVDLLPSFFATFLIYYIIGAVSVEGNKELVNRIFHENSGNQADEFRKQSRV